MNINKLNEEIIEVISKQISIDKNIEKRVQTLIECLSDQNQINELKKVFRWFEKKVNETQVRTEKIDLKKVKDWKYDKSTGGIEHKSGGFFSIIGIRTNTDLREAKGGWDQPFVDQGTESGIVGLIKKRINGIPHYLLQAKFEPGNYGKLIFSPTLQATFSNLNQMHEGKKPLFAKYFEFPKKYDLQYNRWLPEDGGRYYLKRLRNMIIEIDEKEILDTPEDFIWLTLFQIKKMLEKDNIISPHVRSIIAHL